MVSAATESERAGVANGRARAFGGPLGVRSTADVATAHAGRYMRELCGHFIQRGSVTLDARSGRIEFTIGECRLEAGTNALHLVLDASNGAEMATLMSVVHRHLVRCAQREELSIRWRTL